MTLRLSLRSGDPIRYAMGMAPQHSFLALTVALLAALPLLGACDKRPVGNMNNHITNGPPLPEVHPTPVTASAPGVAS